MAIQPIFLLSISRSGSTLVQRVIAAHDGVATTAEPWLLLPQAYTLRASGVDAEYVHSLLVAAVEDFADSLPGGRDEYVDALRAFILDLYHRSGGDGARYFLDKTPPYSLIAEELLQIFPEGRFIFLWRNPLSILASMIDAWGPWSPTFMSDDLFIGLPRLIAAFDGHREKAHSVRYEDLVSGDHAPWEALMDYLDLDFDPDALTRFASVDLPGRMGDPNRSSHSAVRREADDKWRKLLANPLRREWARRYLRFLGPDRLEVMGFEQTQLLSALDSVPSAYESLISDSLRAVIDIAKEPIRVRTRYRRIGAPSAIRRLL